MPEFTLIEADCIQAMASMDEASVDAIVTDPPYGLEFMGKEWDRLGATNEAASDSPGWRRGHGGLGVASKVNGVPFGGGGQRVRYGSSAASSQTWHQAWATQALRVLKPGGHLLAFGGTRTFHRLTCGLEDAGFEIRDCLAWLYGSGFPKSLDVSKAIDKAAGAEREVVAVNKHAAYPNGPGGVGFHGGPGEYSQIGRGPEPLTAPATPEAQRWQGWGTALKPAMEPVVLARKPLTGTVAQNVLEHGTGALNIDGTRIETNEELHAPGPDRGSAWRMMEGREPIEREGFEQHPSGRWPANVLLDEEAAALLDEQTGELVSGPESDKGHRRNADREANRSAYGGFQGQEVTGVLYGDRGGASRFFKVVQNVEGVSAKPNLGGTPRLAAPSTPLRFRYMSKADREERNRGLGHRDKGWPVDGADKWTEQDRRRGEGITRSPAANVHPTVKPVELMQWLCRLITPPHGTVLDPFTGSGSTGMAALREGFTFIGIEREHEYVEIARDRIIGDAPLLNTEAI